MKIKNISTMGNGSMICPVEWDSTPGKKVHIIEERFLMARNMEKGCINFQMELFMMDSSNTTISMVLASYD